MIRLQLRPDAVGPISRGHPWVYANGLDSTPPPAGTPVLLIDSRNRPAGFGLSDEGNIAVRVLGRTPDRVSNILKKRIHAAVQLRNTRVPTNPKPYRLINGAGDRLPGLVVDRYGPLAIIRIYGQCWVPHLDEVTAVLKQIEGVQSIMRRLGVRRVDQKKGGTHLWGEAIPKTMVVQECGLSFLVRPFTGQKTGLFLDQRENRAFVGARCADKVVTNLFAYTGAFSVYAAASGAKQVHTVDISSPAIEDAKENFRLNGIEPKKHVFHVEDVFKWTPEGQQDVLICDPPSLSHDRKADRAAFQAYRDLAARCGRALSTGGILATASCTARLTRRRWEEAIQKGTKQAGRWSWIWQAGAGPDHPISTGHPEGHYLKFAMLQRTS